MVEKRLVSVGDYVLAGQWFPKIAVFEDTGTRSRVEPGWNAHQFHAHSEFYADFGDYDVTLVLPERYGDKIGATGRRMEPLDRPESDRIGTELADAGDGMRTLLEKVVASEVFRNR